MPSFFICHFKKKKEGTNAIYQYTIFRSVIFTGILFFHFQVIINAANTVQGQKTTVPFVLCLLTIHRFIDKLTLQQYSNTTDSSIHMPSIKSAMKHKGCELTKDFESKRQLCLITAKKLSLYTPNTILITLTVCTETQVVCAYSTN